MARKQQPMAHRPNSTKVIRSRPEKMRMSNQRTSREIKRILAEHARTKETGKPHHQEQPYRKAR